MQDNKLIAEFMGVPCDKDLYTPLCPHTGETLFIPLSQMKYNTSWDWLMPVVKKIEEHNELIDAHILSTDIDKSYHGVVKFIKEYNKCNKMDTLPPSVQQG